MPPVSMGSQTQVNPGWIYQQLVGQGLSPTAAAALTAISGRESNYSSQAESWYRPNTGDYFSTGLFQENLGWGYGPGGIPDPHGGPSQLRNIHGQSVGGQFNTSDPFGALYGNAQNDILAAAQLYKTGGGLQPWQHAGGPLGGIPTADLQAAVNASGGAVTMQMLQALGANPSAALGQSATANIQNSPQSASAAIDQFWATQNAQDEMKWVAEQEQQARNEAGYQRQNLLLSEGDLQTQQAALLRQMALAPKEQHITEAQYQQQFADMLRNYKTNREQQWSGEAAGGSFFTRGARDDRSNLRANYYSSVNQLGLSKRAEELNYQEKIKQMNDQWKTLHNMALRYGITQQEIETRLKAQLSNIEYGGLSSLYPLMAQVAQDQLTASLGNAAGLNLGGNTGGPLPSSMSNASGQTESSVGMTVPGGTAGYGNVAGPPAPGALQQYGAP